MKNTSISLGNYFDEFVQNQVSAGRYKNVSEVIRAGLRMLEDEESKVIALRNAVQEGLNSPLVEDFDFDEKQLVLIPPNLLLMGKGDKKTRRGKMIKGSYGVRRKTKRNKRKEAVKKT